MLMTECNSLTQTFSQPNRPTNFSIRAADTFLFGPSNFQFRHFVNLKINIIIPNYNWFVNIKLKNSEIQLKFDFKSSLYFFQHAIGQRFIEWVTMTIKEFIVRFLCDKIFSCKSKHQSVPYIFPPTFASISFAFNRFQYQT